MKNVKCSDCAEYINEWCEKIIDSPYPDMLRDCEYWHERKDMVEVIRCKDCTRFDKKRGCNLVEGLNIAKPDSYCSYAERKKT